MMMRAAKEVLKGFTALTMRGTVWCGRESVTIFLVLEWKKVVEKLRLKESFEQRSGFVGVVEQRPVDVVNGFAGPLVTAL